MKDSFAFPQSGRSVEKRALLLAIDAGSLPVKKNLCLFLSRPAVRPEPVLTPSSTDPNAPDNLAAFFYGTVLFEEDRSPKFRMWYHACHSGLNDDWPPLLKRQLVKYKDTLMMGPACYAESDDGITWVKPRLGQVRFKGSAENNALDLPHALTAGMTLIRDDDETDPQRRYKLVYEFFPRYSDPPFPEYGRMSTLATAVSPDGLRWSDVRVPFRDQFMEQSSFFKHAGRYIAAYQAGAAWDSHFSEGGHPSGRVGLVRYALNFDRWVDGFVESFVLPEPDDPAARGENGRYDQVHLGMGAASFGNVCVGLYGLWRNAPEFHDISCDLGLAVSSDGLVFHEPVKGHIFLNHHDSAATPHPKIQFHTNLCQANGILNVGDQTRIYHGRWRNTGFKHLDAYYGEIALATLPRDRWGALGLFPKHDNGCVWTCPVILPRGGCNLTLNADGADGLAVEVADECFELKPLFSGKQAGRAVSAGGLDVPVAWAGGKPAELGGQTVRFKLNFQRGDKNLPRLYAVNLAYCPGNSFH